MSEDEDSYSNGTESEHNQTEPVPADQYPQAQSHAQNQQQPSTAGLQTSADASQDQAVQSAPAATPGQETFPADALQPQTAGSTDSNVLPRPDKSQPVYDRTSKAGPLRQQPALLPRDGLLGTASHLLHLVLEEFQIDHRQLSEQQRITLVLPAITALSTVLRHQDNTITHRYAVNCLSWLCICMSPVLGAQKLFLCSSCIHV